MINQSRIDELLQEQKTQGFKSTDRLFAKLFLVEWICLIGVAAIVSPHTWAGTSSSIHPHIWTAIFIGGLAISFPLILQRTHPGFAITRHMIAVAQMVLAALLIHLTGGRIESHFLIFGSLAFLAFYRDWRVLITASAIAAVDHILRGAFFPLSVYGIVYASPWRTVEHIFWVIFEDVFLIISCRQGVKEMQSIASRQAEVEASKENVELLVEQRTKQLRQSEKQVTAQYEVSRILAESATLEDSYGPLLECISNCVFGDETVMCSAIWVQEEFETEMRCAGFWRRNETCEDFERSSLSLNILADSDLPGLVRSAGSIKWINDIGTERLARKTCAIESGLKSAVGFPVVIDGRIRAVIEFYTNEPKQPSMELFELLVAIGRQVGQFMLRRSSEETNEQLAKIVESSTDAIYGLNMDLMITGWNRGAEKLYGYSAKDAIGKSVTMLVPADKLQELCELVDKVKEGKCIESLDSTRLRGEQTVEVCLSLAPIYKHGEMVGISQIDRDISERKAAEKRVSEFYSIVSHELRTPLTSIRGALGLIEGGIVKYGSQRCIDLVRIGRESSDRLIRLINDILDLKKIESGKFDLQLQPIAADALLAEAVNSLKGMADERGIKLSVEQEPPPVTINVDKDRCTQVLANLISNAVKFSKNGSEVRVNGIVEAEQIRFTIVDNGPGIPDEELPNLFQKFRQLDSSDTRRIEGTGLGLAVSKALVEQHGGNIGVKSKVGLGSTFWFEIPLCSKSAG